jgi:hypothetical protein
LFGHAALAGFDLADRVVIVAGVKQHIARPVNQSPVNATNCLLLLRCIQSPKPVVRKRRTLTLAASMNR